LKEAGVQLVEGEAGKAIGEAKKLEAEAQRIHAQAERERQAAARGNVERRPEEDNLEEERLELPVEYAERVAEATERVADAIRTIRQKGGDVLFDSDEIKALMAQIGRQGTGQTKRHVYHEIAFSSRSDATLVEEFTSTITTHPIFDEYDILYYRHNVGTSGSVSVTIMSLKPIPTAILRETAESRKLSPVEVERQLL